MALGPLEQQLEQHDSSDFKLYTVSEVVLSRVYCLWNALKFKCIWDLLYTKGILECLVDEALQTFIIIVTQ